MREDGDYYGVDHADADRLTSRLHSSTVDSGNRHIVARPAAIDCSVEWQKRKTCVRHSVNLCGGFNTGANVISLYQVRTHPPLIEVGRRKTGASIRPRGLDTSTFLRTHYKHFPTARVISAHLWGITAGRKAVRPS